MLDDRTPSAEAAERERCEQVVTGANEATKLKYPDYAYDAPGPVRYEQVREAGNQMLLAFAEHGCDLGFRWVDTEMSRVTLPLRSGPSRRNGGPMRARRWVPCSGIAPPRTSPCAPPWPR